MLQSKKSTFLFLALVFVLAFAVRLVSYRILAGGLNEPPPAKTDAVEYDLLAKNILNGNGFKYGPEHPPTSFRPPLYPLFLAAVYSVFGQSFLAVRLTQFLLSALCCYLIWRLALLLTGGKRRIAALSALLAVIEPSMFYHSGFLLTESLYILFLLLACLALAKLGKEPVPRNHFLAGLTLALLCLLRSNAIFFLGFLFFWLWAVSGKFLKALKMYGAVLAVFALCLSPWVARNYHHFKKITFISSNGGMNFWGANNPVILTEKAAQFGAWKGGIIYDVSYLPGSEDLDTQWLEKEFDQFELDQRSWRLGLDYLKNSPSSIPVLVWHKFLRFWSTDIRNNPWERLAFIVLDQALIPFALLGLALCIRKNKSALLLLFWLLSVQVSALIFFADTRMRVGIAPALVFYAAVGLDWLMLRVKALPAARKGEAYAR